MRLSKSPKKAGDDSVATFAWEFVMALAALKYWSSDEQLERLNKAKEELSLRAVTILLLVEPHKVGKSRTFR